MHSGPSTHRGSRGRLGAVLPRCGGVLDGLCAFCALFRLLGSATPTLRLHLSPGEASWCPPRVPTCCRPEVFARPDVSTIGHVRRRAHHELLTPEPRLRVGEFPGCTGSRKHLGVSRAYVLGAEGNSVISSIGTELVQGWYPESYNLRFGQFEPHSKSAKNLAAQPSFPHSKTAHSKTRVRARTDCILPGIIKSNPKDPRKSQERA